MVIRGNRYPSDFEAKKSMIEIGKKLAGKQYCIAEDGSLSMRVGPNAIWITEMNSVMSELTQDSFIRVDLNGKQQIRSSDKMLPEDLDIHLNIYLSNDKLRSIIHSYPLKLVRINTSGGSITGGNFSPSTRKIGTVPCIEQDDTAIAKVSQISMSTHGFMVKNDGCFTYDEVINKAFHTIDILCYLSEVNGCNCSECNVCHYCDSCSKANSNCSQKQCNCSHEHSSSSKNYSCSENHILSQCSENSPVTPVKDHTNSINTVEKSMKEVTSFSAPTEIVKTVVTKKSENIQQVTYGKTICGMTVGRACKQMPDVHNNESSDSDTTKSYAKNQPTAYQYRPLPKDGITKEVGFLGNIVPDVTKVPKQKVQKFVVDKLIGNI